jgi:hypothetical protein
MARPPVKTLKRHSEILCKRIVFERATRAAAPLDIALCERCKAREATDWAHLIRRRYSVTRCDPKNGAALCRECHDQIDKSPVSMLAFVKKQMGLEEYEAMERRAHDGLAALNMTAGAFWFWQHQLLKAECEDLGLSTKWAA